MKTRKFIILLALLCLFALPRQALADAGTPLMWAGFLHLFFGNAIIGLLEGLAIGWLFAVRKGRAILAMILANYFSAWIGYLFVGDVGHRLPMDLNTAWRWFWFVVVATYLLTLILEWPFVAWCFRGGKNWFRKSIRASFVVQTASYLVLFGWYWAAMDAGIYTKMQVVPVTQLSLPEQVSVYFISARDGDVYRRSLTGASEQKVYDLHSRSMEDRLVIRPASDDTNRLELVVRRGGARFPQSSVAVVGVIRAQAVPTISPSDPQFPGVHGSDQSLRLGSAMNSDWITYVEPWNGSVICYNRRTPRFESLAFETPLCAWAAWNPVLLPSDVVLFQFGDDQICVFSPKQRKLALLWRGRGAVPVIEPTGVEPGGAMNPAL